jgi:hypothetical protein
LLSWAAKCGHPIFTSYTFLYKFATKDNDNMPKISISMHGRQ